MSSDIDSTAHVVEDLIPGVAYIFRVSACNEVGVGRHSNPSEPVSIVAEKEYDSDSPTSEQAVLKTTPIEFEYDLREELTRWGGGALEITCTTGIVLVSHFFL